MNRMIGLELIQQYDFRDCFKRMHLIAIVDDDAANCHAITSLVCRDETDTSDRRQPSKGGSTAAGVLTINSPARRYPPVGFLRISTLAVASGLEYCSFPRDKMAARWAL